MSRQRRLRWAIVGVGTAGRARGNAIIADPRSLLVAVHRGRYANEFETEQATSFDEAVRTADAVAVCSPNQHHADQVERVLEAARHAVVEYPVASAAKRAKGLFALATRQRRVLHVEHIELLGSAATTLNALVRPAVVTEVLVQFERPGDGDVPGATLALTNVARLHRMVDVAGEAGSVTSVDHRPGQLDAELALKSGAVARIHWRQGRDVERRRTRMRVTTPGAVWDQAGNTLTRNGTPQTLLGTGSLFRIDHERAMERILGEGEAYVPDDRILHVLRIVEMLQNGATGPIN